MNMDGLRGKFDLVTDGSRGIGRTDGDTVAFLLSREAAGVTGQTVVIDGDVTLGRGR